MHLVGLGKKQKADIGSVEEEEAISGASSEVMAISSLTAAFGDVIKDRDRLFLVNLRSKLIGSEELVKDAGVVEKV